MPIKAKPVCGKGHERPPGGDCPECNRQRALARYHAKKGEINPARNEKRRGTYLPRKDRNLLDSDGNLLCNKGLHRRESGKPCQECRREHFRQKNGLVCPKGHARETDVGRCPECVREYQAQWHAEHKDTENAKALERYHDLKAQGIDQYDPERVRRWRLKNPERRREHGRAYYFRHSERMLEYTRQWRLANPERANEIGRAAASRRNARKKGAEGSHTQAEWEAIIAKQRGFCLACGENRKLTKDHIVPLSRGGCDYAFNIQGLCKPCNSRKRASMAAGLQHSLFDRLHVVEIIRRE